MATPKQLTLDEARTALTDVTAAFDQPENAEKMTKARAEAGYVRGRAPGKVWQALASFYREGAIARRLLSDGRYAPRAALT